MMGVEALVSRMQSHVAEIARRQLQRTQLDGFAIMLIDVGSELGKLLEVPAATKNGISLYTVPLSIASSTVSAIDSSVAVAMARRPQRGDVRLVVVAAGVLAVVHFPVAASAVPPV